jgi:hypothetical protein
MCIETNATIINAVGDIDRDDLIRNQCLVDQTQPIILFITSMIMWLTKQSDRIRHCVFIGHRIITHKECVSEDGIDTVYCTKTQFIQPPVNNAVCYSIQAFYMNPAA